MAEAISREEFELPAEISSLTEESFWRFLDWERGSSRIRTRVIGKFEPGLFARTGYNDENRPEEKIVDSVPLGDRVFRIQTSPTTKTPAYSDIVEGFGAYLDFLKEQREVDEAMRRGVLTIDEELYVHLDVLEAKLKRDKEEILKGKEGVAQQTLGILGPDGLMIEAGKDAPPPVFVVSFDIDYSRTTPNNGMIYWHAINFLEAWGARASAFKKEVKEDSLVVLGGEPERPVAIRYVFPTVVFYHQLEPRSRIAYGDVVEAFMKPKPHQIRRKGKIGDFPKAHMIIEEQAEAFLREKELVDDAFMRDYSPRRREDRIYVRLLGVKDRLVQYQRGSPYLEQNLFVRRT